MASKNLSLLRSVIDEVNDELESELPKYNHLFAYAKNNPIQLSDATGLQPGAMAFGGAGSFGMSRSADSQACMSRHCERAQTKCIAKYSEVLPTRDFGASFRVCYNRCMVDAGCTPGSAGGW